MKLTHTTSRVNSRTQTHADALSTRTSSPSTTSHKPDDDCHKPSQTSRRRPSSSTTSMASGSSKAAYLALHYGASGRGGSEGGDHLDTTTPTATKTKKKKKKKKSVLPSGNITITDADEEDMNQMKKIGDAMRRESRDNLDAYEAGDVQRRRRYDSDDDLSPPRRRYDAMDRGGPAHDAPSSRTEREEEDLSLSPPRRRRRHRNDSDDDDANEKDDDGDLSPPRQRQRASSSSASPPSSSPRRRSASEKERERRRGGRHESDDDDVSPLRRARDDQGGGGGGGDGSGRKAGLRTADELRIELENARRDDLARLDAMDRDGASGRGAETVVRRRKRWQDEDEEEKPSGPVAWGGGLVQADQRAAAMRDAAEEAAKPFARRADDRQLDASLRDAHRFGDPMANRGEQLASAMHAAATDDDAKRAAGPSGAYRIPSGVPPHSWLRRQVTPAPNRYGIRPGSFWDGVDRSTGFEVELFASQADIARRERDARAAGMEDM